MNNEPSGSRVLFPDESPIFLNGVTSCTTLFKDTEADVDLTPWHCTSANGKPQMLVQPQKKCWNGGRFPVSLSACRL